MKYTEEPEFIPDEPSPPCGWCGLKYHLLLLFQEKYVTTLRVVWIEIRIMFDMSGAVAVTTLRVVWIEISIIILRNVQQFVTTLRVVWIEIRRSLARKQSIFVTTLRVVWIEIL